MSDDPRLDTLIKKGQSGDVVLVGYPFEHASIRMRKKGGQENGPCCLRRFFKKVGPLINSQYQIDISGLKVSDYGNIHGNSKNPKELEGHLHDVISGLLGQGKIPITIGGSRETTLASSNSFLERYPEGEMMYFCGYPSVSRPYDHDKLSSNSLFQLLPESHRKQYLLLGTQEKYWPPNSKVNLRRIDMQDIRQVKTQLHPEITSPRTQAGTLVSNILKESKCESVYVSLSLEVMSQFMGTYYRVFGGLSVEEVLEVMLMLGSDPRVKCVDITEFNPSNEDYNSSLTILNMIYYFLMGNTLRVKQQH